MKKVDPIFAACLLPRLDELLISFLRKLSSSDWERQTLAPGWSVKDVAAHLLDSNMRTLSILRDGYFGENGRNTGSNDDLITFLNRLNADWTRAFRRISPLVLTDLLESTGAQFCRHMQSLDPNTPAVLSVAWAGESQSSNWFHIAREYTEKWHHQQQIRFAVGDDEALLIEHLYQPYLDTSMRALPHHYRDFQSKTGHAIRFTVPGLAGATWYLVRSENIWELYAQCEAPLVSTVEIDKRIAWRIFTRGINKADARGSVRINGNLPLGEHVLDMIAVMA
jgi:uncharacterized protein (TIGR03083 family)